MCSIYNETLAGSTWACTILQENTVLCASAYAKPKDVRALTCVVGLMK